MSQLDNGMLEGTWRPYTLKELEDRADPPEVGDEDDMDGPEESDGAEESDNEEAT